MNVSLYTTGPTRLLIHMLLRDFLTMFNGIVSVGNAGEKNKQKLGHAD